MKTKISWLCGVALFSSTAGAIAAPGLAFDILSCDRTATASADTGSWGEIQHLDFFYDPFADAGNTEVKTVKGYVAITFAPQDGDTNRLLADYQITQQNGLRAEFSLPYLAASGTDQYTLNVPGFDPKGNDPVRNLPSTLTLAGVATHADLAFSCSSVFRK
jgi:hypothetical protein